MSNGILVIGELANGTLHTTTRQITAAAEKVVGDNRDVTLCLPAESTFDTTSLDGMNVNNAILLDHPDAPQDSASGIYSLTTELICEAVKRLQPAAVIIAKTDAGSVISARLAVRFNAGLASDCIDLALNAEGRIAVTRPVHGGNALAVYEFPGQNLQVVAIRPGAFEPAEPTTSTPDIERLDLSHIQPASPSPTLIETVIEESEGIPLEQADVVVSGGRGLGGPEPFDQLRELCGLLNAALGASRAACDAGWIDHSHQVGLTGKSISPTTYITVGISGASQHMAGCSSARNIVAIDKDREANIFSHARYGVVGDWAKVLPAFTAAVAELD